MSDISEEYRGLIAEFRKFFNRILRDDEVDLKEGGLVGDEDVELGLYIWDKNQNSIEYYVNWLPHYRGSSHGIIYKDGRHEHLATLPQFGEVTQAELVLRKELEEKGLIAPLPFNIYNKKKSPNLNLHSLFRRFIGR